MGALTARLRFVLYAAVVTALAGPVLLFFLLRLVLSNDALLLEHVAERRTPLVELAIWAGADPNYRDEDGSSALPVAVELGDAAIARTLLDASADPDAFTSDGEPVATLAVRGGESEILETLLDAGADPNAKDESGIAVLVLAVIHGVAEMSRMLLDAGADPNTLAEEGLSVLAIAVDRGDTESCGCSWTPAPTPTAPGSRSSPRDPATPTCSSYSRPGRSPRSAADPCRTWPERPRQHRHVHRRHALHLHPRPRLLGATQPPPVAVRPTATDACWTVHFMTDQLATVDFRKPA